MGPTKGEVEAQSPRVQFPSPDIGVDTLADRARAQRTTINQFKVEHDFQFTDRVKESGITFVHHIVDAVWHPASESSSPGWPQGPDPDLGRYHARSHGRETRVCHADEKELNGRPTGSTHGRAAGTFFGSRRRLAPGAKPLMARKEFGGALGRARPLPARSAGARVDCPRWKVCGAH